MLLILYLIGEKLNFVTHNMERLVVCVAKRLQVFVLFSGYRDGIIPIYLFSAHGAIKSCISTIKQSQNIKSND